MRVIVVPDLHGKDFWKQINPDLYDKIIFLGDYVDAPYRKATDVLEIDSFQRIVVDEYSGRTNGEILYNLNEIIRFKNDNFDKVELLIGNHDNPYIYHIKNKQFQSTTMCSGFRHSMENDLSYLFNKNIKLFKVAYQIKDVIFSHAGITPQAYKLYFKNRLNDNFDIFVEELNKFYILNEPELFYTSSKRGGKQPCGSIFWADKSEFLEDKYIFPFRQVVGHSHVNDISYLYNDMKISDEIRTDAPNVIFTDCLDSKISFYEMEI